MLLTASATRRHLLMIAAIGGSLALAGVAEAGSGKKHRTAVSQTYYAPSTVDYARVTSVTPVMQRISTQVPVRECVERPAVMAAPYRPGSTAGPTIAGGVIGGVIGNQFGSGSGRDAMRLLGVLVGASIGHDVAHQRQYAYAAGPAVPVTECTTRYQTRLEDRLVAYRVTYEYNGRRYETETLADPGEYIPVTVDVRPRM